MVLLVISVFSRCLRGELPETLSQHAVEGGEWVDDVRERTQRSAQLGGQHEFAQGSLQHSPCAQINWTILRPMLS